MISGIDALPSFTFINDNHAEYKTFITQEMLKEDIWLELQFIFPHHTLMR